MENKNNLGRRIVKLLATTFAVWVAAELVPGIQVDSFWTALLVGVVLALLNIVIKPILTVISIPFILITFGLFLLVINAVLLSFASEIVEAFVVEEFFWDAILGSLIISLVSGLLEPRDPKKPEDGQALHVQDGPAA